MYVREGKYIPLDVRNFLNDMVAKYFKVRYTTPASVCVYLNREVSDLAVEQGMFSTEYYLGGENGVTFHVSIRGGNEDVIELIKGNKVVDGVETSIDVVKAFARLDNGICLFFPSRVD